MNDQRIRLEESVLQIQSKGHITLPYFQKLKEGVIFTDCSVPGLVNGKMAWITPNYSEFFLKRVENCEFKNLRDLIGYSLRIGVVLDSDSWLDWRSACKNQEENYILRNLLLPETLKFYQNKLVDLHNSSDHATGLIQPFEVDVSERGTQSHDINGVTFYSGPLTHFINEHSKGNYHEGWWKDLEHGLIKC